MEICSLYVAHTEVSHLYEASVYQDKTTIMMGIATKKDAHIIVEIYYNE